MVKQQIPHKWRKNQRQNKHQNNKRQIIHSFLKSLKICYPGVTPLYFLNFQIKAINTNKKIV